MKLTINPKHAALDAIKGLDLGDVLSYFDAKATPRDKQIVEMVDTEDEGFECDNDLVSEGEDNGAYVLGWRWVSFHGTELSKVCDDCEEPTEKVITERDGTKRCLCKTCIEDITCPDCGAVEGTDEWGTVGDGFDGYCPSCADKREANGKVEVG